MIKLTIIGAGSAVFTKNIVTDILSLGNFKNMEIALQDIDPLRLKASHDLLNIISEKLNASPKIVSYLDRKESLKKADFVQTTIQVGGYNPSTIIVKILKELKEIRFDKGTKNFQPTNLEVTKINVNNNADNVIPAEAEATFNIRFNNKHSSKSLKKRLNIIFKKISKKHKSKFKIEYRVSGEAFLTKPNKTTFMVQNVIKKITKIKPKLYKLFNYWK